MAPAGLGAVECPPKALQRSKVPLARQLANTQIEETLADALAGSPADGCGLLVAEAPRPFTRSVRRLGSAEVDELVERYEDGERNIDLARHYGIDSSTVWKHLHDRGVNSSYLAKCEWPPEKVALAIKRYATGATLAEIGVEMGCARNTVRRRLLAAGVTLRTRGRKQA